MQTPIPLQTSALAVLGLGLLLGLKHATDADHIVAVTTFVSQQKRALRACWIGIFWGIGHTASLLLAGLVVVLLKVDIPHWLAARMELGVAVMLVLLGVRVLMKNMRSGVAIHSHEHGHGVQDSPSHKHWHVHTDGVLDRHQGWGHVGLRPLLVGAVHGAAGSGALMLLVLTSIPSSIQALLYIFVFGIGSIAGMMLCSLLVAAPLCWAQRRLFSSTRTIQLTAGFLSCVFGIYLGVEIWQSLP